MKHNNTSILNFYRTGSGQWVVHFGVNRSRRLQERGANLVLLAFIIGVLILALVGVQLLEVTANLNKTKKHVRKIAARSGYYLGEPYVENAVRQNVRVTAARLQQLISATPNDTSGGGGGGGGPVKQSPQAAGSEPPKSIYAQRISAGRPPFTRDEARDLFRQDFTITYGSLAPRQPAEFADPQAQAAWNRLVDHFSQVRVTGWAKTTFDSVLPLDLASKLTETNLTPGLPTDANPLSNYVYQVTVEVKIVSEEWLDHGDPVADAPPPPSGTDQYRWLKMYGQEGTPPPVPGGPPVVSSVPDDAICLQNSQYPKGACGPTAHWQFEFADADGNAVCSCHDNDTTVPPTQPKVGNGEGYKQTSIMNPGGGPRVAVGHNTPDRYRTGNPRPPGIIAPVVSGDPLLYSQRARYSGSVKFVTWIRFAAGDGTVVSPPCTDNPSEIIPEDCYAVSIPIYGPNDNGLTPPPAPSPNSGENAAIGMVCSYAPNNWASIPTTGFNTYYPISPFPGQPGSGPATHQYLDTNSYSGWRNVFPGYSNLVQDYQNQVNNGGGNGCNIPARFSHSPGPSYQNLQICFSPLQRTEPDYRVARW